MFGLKADWSLEVFERYFTMGDYAGGEARWCPGCGDHAVLSAAQRVLRDEQQRPEKSVCVSGIGCSSRMPHYLGTYGFHGLHGRALPVACGVKSRRPDLDVWVATGDGDCFSIGTAHWIHALRYNMDMTLMVFDNAVYGLTKAQTSPTSPAGFKTNTHPFGAILEPVNPLTVTLGVTNVSFVAQVVDWNPPLLYQTLKAAYRHHGTGFVRIIQRCAPVEALRRFHLSGKGLPRVPEGWTSALLEGLTCEATPPSAEVLERLEALPPAVRPEDPARVEPTQLFWLIAHPSVVQARAELRTLVEKRLSQLEELIRVEEQRQPPTASSLADSIGAAGRALFEPGRLLSVLSRKSPNAAPDPERLERLRTAQTRLRTYLHRPSRPSVMVMHSPSIEPGVEGLIGAEARVEERPVTAAVQWFDEEAENLAEVVAAMRTAQLEFDGDYDVDKHGPWLRSLSWSSLTTAELDALPSVIALVDPQVACRGQLECLSRVLHGRRPIHVLSFIDPSRDPAEPVTPSHSARTELGAIGLAHASAFIHQSSRVSLDHCLEGLSRARARTGPSLHLIAQPCVASGREDEDMQTEAEWAAAAGRAHPRFIYDPDAELSLAHMFELGPNPEPAAAWPAAPVPGPEAGPDEQAFTFVDFALLCPAYRAQFTPVAPTVTPGNLIPVAAYLRELETESAGEAEELVRLPTVWAKDPYGRLERLVVSASLCRAAVERQAFWRSLQEMAGIRNVHVERAVAAAREAAEAEHARRIEELEARHRSELEAAREQAAREAIVRLVDALASGPESWSAAPSVGAAPPSPVAPTEASTTTTEAAPPAEPQAAAEAPPAPVSQTPWIESALCTSCGDCININSQLFVYDENRQARIGDVAAGTFKELVTAAEKCPSRCIHPGRPTNPNEKNLEALIARAEKFD
jgi:pyruvate/2-oxoacid:ferredoxin oxidoreductase beta subunit/ferredoxin